MDQQIDHEPPGLSHTVSANTSRVAKALRFGRKNPFAAFMAMAALLFGIYFSVVHPPLYTATTQFSIRGKENTQPASVLAAFIPSGGSGGISEAIAVREHIHSPAMLSELDARHDLRAHYSGFRLDPLNRISAKASPEDLLAFHRKRIDVVLDREASILKVVVRAYDPQMAYDLAGSILTLSENYVNDISTSVRDATLSDARDEVRKAEEEVREIRLQLAFFRNTTGEIDPTQTGAATVSAIVDLESSISNLRADRASQLASLRADAPQVKQIEARIATLERQADDRRRELASTGAGGSLAGLLQEYEGLVIQREYAETRLTAALTALDNARQLADQRERFVVPIVAPTLPTEATEPRRMASFLLAMVLSVIGFGIVAYTIAGINDHDR